MNCLGTSVRIKTEPKWASMSWDRDCGQRYIRDGASWPKLWAKYIKSVRRHMYLTACSVGNICFERGSGVMTTGTVAGFMVPDR